MNFSKFGNLVTHLQNSRRVRFFGTAINFALESVIEHTRERQLQDANAALLESRTENANLRAQLTSQITGANAAQDRIKSLEGELRVCNTFKEFAQSCFFKPEPAMPQGSHHPENDSSNSWRYTIPATTLG